MVATAEELVEVLAGVMEEVPVQEADMVEELAEDTVEEQEVAPEAATVEELAVVPVVDTAKELAVATEEVLVEAMVAVLALAAVEVTVVVPGAASAAVSDSTFDMHAWLVHAACKCSSTFYAHLWQSWLMSVLYGDYTLRDDRTFYSKQNKNFSTARLVDHNCIMV